MGTDQQEGSSEKSRLCVIGLFTKPLNVQSNQSRSKTYIGAHSLQNN